MNLETGDELARIPGPKSAPLSAAFSPDGKTLAVGFADKLIRLWDLSKLKTDFVKLDKESKTLEGHERGFNAARLWQDDQTLVSAGCRQVDHHLGRRRAQSEIDAEGARGRGQFARAHERRQDAGECRRGQLIFWDADRAKKRQAIATPFRGRRPFAVADDKTVALGGTETKLGTDIGVVRFFGVGDGKESRTAISIRLASCRLRIGPTARVPRAAEIS